MASQALATLTATYTDSEGEEDMEYGHTPKGEPKNNEPEPSCSKQSAETSKPKKSGLPPKLVSYIDDSVITDEESPSAEDRDNMQGQPMETDTDRATSSTSYSLNEVSIPPEPPGKCPKELQDLITKYYNRMINEGLDMNKLIQEKKNFRNPSIYEKLIQYCDINELDTNYPPEIYDPLMWGKESYYDELAKAQALEMSRREKEKRSKIAKIDLTSYQHKKPESEDEKKRKTKWDMAAPSAPPKPTVKQPGLMPPLTSKATGTKSTVISAYGSLPKKSRR